MAVTEDQVRDALTRVLYPGFSRDIVSLGLVRNLRVSDGSVELELGLGPTNESVSARIREAAGRVLNSLPGVVSVTIRVVDPTGKSPALNVLGSEPPRHVGQDRETGLLPSVRHAVAVASGKGGVGKSTVAVNLAVALARRGITVGLLDADVYGPSIPLMMGAQRERPRNDPVKRQALPLERYGVRFMSLGFFVDPESAVIWRGPMVIKALEELLHNVQWGDLDVLVVDLPPGTGDAQLTLAQSPRIRLSGAVIVTTPQDVALADAIKGVAMFRKVDVPVLGLVENMSYFQCPHCAERTDIFGHGGGRKQAGRLGVPFLGEIPLESSIRQSGDAGEPVAAREESGAASAAFLNLADDVLTALKEGSPVGESASWTGVAPRKES